MRSQKNKMERYFFEVAYDGSGYGGFQIQNNTVTIQGELEKALKIFFKIPISLTGSSRTDAGVHARQNFFHADFQHTIIDSLQKTVYHINAILPPDIVLKNMVPVGADAHCRFDALSRSYYYYIYQQKDPFLRRSAFYYPYPVDLELINSYAAFLLDVTEYESFSKKHTNAGTFECKLSQSCWSSLAGGIIRYEVQGNRFLRGMVRGLVGTMLKYGRSSHSSLEAFQTHVYAKSAARTDFSPPGIGLILQEVSYPKEIFTNIGH